MCIGKLCWRGECPFVRWIMSVCAVDNVRHVKTGEGENVRPVKKMRWQMTAYALFDEGENVRGGKCPPFIIKWYPDKQEIVIGCSYITIDNDKKSTYQTKILEAISLRVLEPISYLGR